MKWSFVRHSLSLSDGGASVPLFLNFSSGNDILKTLKINLDRWLILIVMKMATAVCGETSLTSSNICCCILNALNVYQHLLRVFKDIWPILGKIQRFLNGIWRLQLLSKFMSALYRITSLTAFWNVFSKYSNAFEHILVFLNVFQCFWKSTNIFISLEHFYEHFLNIFECFPISMSILLSHFKLITTFLERF